MGPSFGSTFYHDLFVYLLKGECIRIANFLCHHVSARRRRSQHIRVSPAPRAMRRSEAVVG
jgi:hypothetical protein